MRGVLRGVLAVAVLAGIAAVAIRLHGDPQWGRDASFAIAAGAAFGAILQRSKLCFASAFRDLLLFRNRKTFMGLLAALAVGSVGYLAVYPAWIPDPGLPWLPQNAHITPVGWHLAAGGASFGLGMVLAGGCISGQLYRLGEGSVAAPVALAGVGLGFVAAFNAWDQVWVKWVAGKPPLWLPHELGYAGALGAQLGGIGLLAVLALVFGLAPPAPPAQPAGLRLALRKVFVQPWPAWVGGAALGFLATLALFRGQPLGVTSEIGRQARRAATAVKAMPDRLEGLENLRGCSAMASLDKPLTSNGLFVLAMVGGSLAAALAAGEFRPRRPKLRTLVLALVGGVLLGFGAMISLGCTIGTLLSGIHAFSLSGWIFAAGLVPGAWLGGQFLRRIA